MSPVEWWVTVFNAFDIPGCHEEEEHIMVALPLASLWLPPYMAIALFKLCRRPSVQMSPAEWWVTIFNVFDFAGCHKDEENLNVTSAPTQASSGSNCWILTQQNDGSDDQFFNRDWNSYSEGFGDASGNFWIGNKHLHLMTQLLNQGLQFAVFR